MKHENTNTNKNKKAQGKALDMGGEECWMLTLGLWGSARNITNNCE
jgi:hypothetical protein